MKFLPLAIAVIFSICLLHSATAQDESNKVEEAVYKDLQTDEVSEAMSDGQEVTSDGDLQENEVLVYAAEKSELPRLMAKRRFPCRFCCKRWFCGICCSF